MLETISIGSFVPAVLVTASDKARAITCAAVQPAARSSRMPVSPSDLLSFCEGDFMISG